MGSKMNFDKGLHFGNNLLFSFNKIIGRAHGPWLQIIVVTGEGNTVRLSKQKETKTYALW
jgi:uridylate kinase